MKNKDDYVLTIDFGTQSVRTIIFDYNGNVIAFAKSEYEEPYFSPAPGYCEQNPEYYWEHMLKTTNEVARQAPDVLKKIKSMGITCFRDTPVFLDKDLNVVRPSILWLDQRQAVLKEKLPLFHRFAFKIVGMSEVVKLNMKRTPAIWWRRPGRPARPESPRVRRRPGARPAAPGRKAPAGAEDRPGRRL